MRRKSAINEFPLVYPLQAMLVYKSVYLLITILVFKSSYVNGSNQLHIGGIFPIAGKGGWQGGQGRRAARRRFTMLNITNGTCGNFPSACIRQSLLFICLSYNI